MVIQSANTWVCLKMLCTPLYPMVLLIIIPIKNGYFIGNINPTFSDKPTLIFQAANVASPDGSNLSLRNPARADPRGPGVDPGRSVGPALKPFLPQEFHQSLRFGLKVIIFFKNGFLMCIKIYNIIWYNII